MWSEDNNTLEGRRIQEGDDDDKEVGRQCGDNEEEAKSYRRW